MDSTEIYFRKIKIVGHLADIGEALIKARNEGTSPFVAIEAVMPWERFAATVEEAKQLVDEDNDTP